MKKPMIRHCRNCEWASEPKGLIEWIKCAVKYKEIWKEDQRLTALFCRFYNQKDGEQE